MDLKKLFGSSVLALSLLYAQPKVADACTGARQNLMGGTGISHCDNSNAVYWNPALLAGRDFEYEVSRTVATSKFNPFMSKLGLLNLRETDVTNIAYSQKNWGVGIQRMWDPRNEWLMCSYGIMKKGSECSYGIGVVSTFGKGKDFEGHYGAYPSLFFKCGEFSAGILGIFRGGVSYRLPTDTLLSVEYYGPPVGVYGGLCFGVEQKLGPVSLWGGLDNGINFLWNPSVGGGIDFGKYKLSGGILLVETKYWYQGIVFVENAWKF